MKTILGTENKELLSFISEDNNCYSYLHVTTSEENAKNILDEGFHYTYNFHKTVDRFDVRNMTTLNWLRIIRMQYGNYVIVIEIDRDLLKGQQSNIDALAVDYYEKDGEEAFLLPKEYVKGYYDEVTKQLIKNKYFNPKFSKKDLNK